MVGEQSSHPTLQEPVLPNGLLMEIQSTLGRVAAARTPMLIQSLGGRWTWDKSRTSQDWSSGTEGIAARVSGCTKLLAFELIRALTLVA
jgi:hypothetical protein